MITGKNWQKVKNMNIKPFNITDLKGKDNLSDAKKDKIVDDDYFSIQITIPNGKERVLRICKSDDPEIISENFCKIYGLKDEIKQRLTKTITHFVNMYLNKQADESEFSHHQQTSDGLQEDD